MNVVPATSAALEAATRCLVGAFANDPLTGYFFLSAPGRKQELLARFFSLLLRARMQLDMPVLLAVEDGRVLGVAMGYTTERPRWPSELARSWEQMERSVPAMAERIAAYEAISERGVPNAPHYYLGVIGVDPATRGRGAGARLLCAFCSCSATDPRSDGVYLETATPENIPFYMRAGFAESHRGTLGDETLWCMYLRHRRDA